MDKKDWLDEMLADNSEHDAETLEMISDSCDVLSGEQKNRILDMIREKESGDEAHTEGITTGNEKEENVVSVVEFRKQRTNIIRMFTALAACICVVAGIKMLSDRNKLFIPSGNDSEKVTTISETGRITENTGDDAVSDKAESETRTSVTVPDETVRTETEKPVTEITDERVAEDTSEQTVVNENKTGTQTEVTEERRLSETEVSETVRAEVTTEEEADDRWMYQDIYADVLDTLRLHAPSYNITYIVYDMNNDGKKELAVVTEKNTDDQKLRVYTINKREAVELAVIPVGRKCVFRVDSNTGRLCVESGDEGNGSIVSFEFDGETVSESDSLRDFAYENYQDFLEAAGEKFNLENLTYGRYIGGENDIMSGKDVVGRGNLYSNDYYFMD